MCTFFEWPATEFQSLRQDIAGNVQKTLALLPRLVQRMHGPKREEHFLGTADLPNFFRKPYGRGWLLVGDAGHHKDPLTAHGISDAFRDAALLVEAVDAGFAGRCSPEAALAGYERRRNAAATPQYEHACRSARLESPSPEMTRLVAALHGNQVDTDRYRCGNRRRWMDAALVK